MTKRIPEGYTSITPTIVSKNAAAAIELYKKALGAKEDHRLLNPENGKIMHAALTIGNAKVFLYDENTKMGCVAPGAGGSSVNFYIYVEDADAAQKKGLAAGMKEAMPVTDMFWGDRMGSLIDPDGYRWSIATHVREVSPAEMEKGAKAMCSANKAA